MIREESRAVSAPDTRKKILKWFAFTAVLLLLIACGGVQNEPEEAVEPTVVPAAEEEETTENNIAADKGEEMEMDMEAKSADSMSVSESFPLTIVHDRGEITLEQPAERIIVMSEEFIELAIALEIPLVGVGAGRNQPAEDNTFTQLSYVEQPILGQPIYLDVMEPSQEALLSLNPDLIVRNGAPDGMDDPTHDILADVAPTLTYAAANPGGWITAMRGFGKAVGKSELAEEEITQYETQVNELVAEMEPIVQIAPDVALLVGGLDILGIVDDRFAIGGLMATLGFNVVVPDEVEMTPFGYQQISPEILSVIEADTIIRMRLFDGEAYLGDQLLETLETPAKDVEIKFGSGYAGPFAEIVYLEGFAAALHEAWEEQLAQAEAEEGDG
ncbi:MAG: ABC transporter substrate-binding protein [Chloroflexota bacterium]